MELKSVYKISELAQMAGISRHRMRRLLDSGGVQLANCGSDKVVLLAALREAMPLLWESLLDRASALPD